MILADDHAIFRHGLRAVLELMGGIEIVAECGDGDAALAAYREHRPDALLLDLRMPGSTAWRWCAACSRSTAQRAS